MPCLFFVVVLCFFDVFLVILHFGDVLSFRAELIAI